VAAVAALLAHIEAINSFEASVNGGSKGATAAKKAARQSMAATALEVGGVVGAYAAKVGDTELGAKVDFAASDILYGRDAVAATICKGIYDAANSVLANLTGDYKLTADDLEAFRVKINAYGKTIGKPRTAINKKTAAVEGMDSEFAAVDALLDKQLDGLMKRYKLTEPDFYNEYHAARSTVDNASGQKKDQPQSQPQPQ